MMKGLRVVGVLAMVLAIAHCGDSDVRVSTGPGVVPGPGTFTGTLSDGGSIQIEVGSIEEVSFTCDDEEIQETFTPPQPIDSDGTFNVKFSDGGRDFRVRGTFRDNNNVDGSIDDENNECDVSYEANRGGAVPTPVRTPTGNAATSTPGSGVTSTPGGGGPTVTPGAGATSTPGGGPTNTSGGGATATPGPAGSPCPVGVEVLGTAGDDRILDTGWTGIAHNQPVIQDSKLSFRMTSCDSPVRPCGECTVGGPIANPKAGAGDIASQRCINDTSIHCTDNTPCGSSTCAFFFGAPLPLSAGGVSTCVSNQIDGAVTGTANVESGSFASQIKLKSSVFLVDDVAHPCPLCTETSAAQINDGTLGGTCTSGPRVGLACDGNGRSVLFGTTSLDCPSALSTRAAVLSIDLTGSSSTVTRTLTDASPGCTAVQGKKCQCPPGAGGTGAPTAPNACIDDSATGGDESLCAPTGAPNEGTCPSGPVDSNCERDTFIGCTSNANCASDDQCVSVPRPCYLDNGVIGGSISAIGMADPPVNGESDPVFASMFCIPFTGRSAIDTVAGLPGLGRITLPLHAKEILTLP